MPRNVPLLPWVVAVLCVVILLNVLTLVERAR